ncbi:MAG TPA: protein kinase [Blastocatellia bacterium]|nr:protein kinase [Blastocatellia bacterium]
MSKISDDRASRDTQPVPTFGTSPNLTARLKQSHCDGLLLKDRYLIEGELGRGGIGVVYLARDVQLLQRRVVVKALLQDSEDSTHTSWFKRKFEQEIEALVRLDHPSIVGALDSGAMPDGRLFFVMQFVEGVTLRSLARGELMDLARVAGLLRQIGGALSAAHDKGVVHRDLKPENVMVQTLSDGEDLVKLIDFGIASVKDSQFSTAAERTKVAGALPYMSPEQLRGQPEIASDVWAMGVITYELVTGHLPFDAETMVQLHELQSKGPERHPSAFRPDLPARAERAILKSLSFDPRQRFARAKDLGDELSRALIEPATYSGQVESAAQTTSYAPETARATFKEAESTSVPSAPTKVGQTKVGHSGALQTDTPKTPKPSRIPGILIAAIAVAIIVIVILLARQSIFTNRQTAGQQGQQSPQPPVASPRLLNYSLKVLAKGSSQTPVELPGKIIFTLGDKLRFSFSSPQDGYLYIINEGPVIVNGLPQYNFLFPDPIEIADNAPSLRANQQLSVPKEPYWFDADNQQGTEKHWLIWAERPIVELEAVKKWLNEKDGGEIKDANDIRSVREFLNQNYSAARPVAEEGEHQTHLRGGKDGMLIYPMTVAHR